MLEIVHDLAPGARLAFATTGETLADYVDAFRLLAAAGATLVTEDIALDDEPAFQQGIGAATAESLAQHGIWVSSSAGNLGARHAPRVSAVGTGRGPDGATGPFVDSPYAPDNLVNLRGTDNTYNLNLLPGAAFLGTLQWSEPRAIYPTAGQGGFTDLNLYVMDAAGTTCLASSNAAQADGVGDTIEQLIYQNTTARRSRCGWWSTCRAPRRPHPHPSSTCAGGPSRPASDPRPAGPGRLAQPRLELSRFRHQRRRGERKHLRRPDHRAAGVLQRRRAGADPHHHHPVPRRGRRAVQGRAGRRTTDSSGA
jgi:hypothetical protein